MNVTKFSDKQKQVIHWWEREATENYDGIIADGSIRSGKTISMICGFLLWSQKNFSHKNFILAGVTLGALQRNVIAPMKEILYDWRWSFHENKGIGYLKIGSNYYWYFGGGSDGAQDKMQGLTAAGAYADEAALMSHKFLNQMIGRCSDENAKLWFNCNPEHPLASFKTDFIDKSGEKNLIYSHFTMDDNPGLSYKVKERYKRMFHGVFHDRYIKGLWVVAEGLVYQIDESDYVVDKETAIGEGNGMWYLSCDYGITNPFAALLWRVTPDCAYLVDEYYFDSRERGYRKTDSEHLDAIERLAEGHNIDSIIIDPSASSMKEEIWRRGMFDVQDANNSVLEGIAVTDQMLHDGSIKVCCTCHNTIKERQMYRWDEDAKGDAVIKEYDHAMDAMRYMANTQLKYLLKGYDV